jgi:hypothetical protein
VRCEFTGSTEYVAEGLQSGSFYHGFAEVVLDKSGKVWRLRTLEGDVTRSRRDWQDECNVSMRLLRGESRKIESTEQMMS